MSLWVMNDIFSKSTNTLNCQKFSTSIKKINSNKQSNWQVSRNETSSLSRIRSIYFDQIAREKSKKLKYRIEN